MFYESDDIYPQFAAAVRRVAARKGSVVIDAGTDRRFRKNLAPFRRDFEGVTYLALAHTLAERQGPDRANLQGDVQALPFRNASVDGLVCFDVLEHVPDPPSAVREIHRVLKPGGAAVLTLPFFHPYHGAGAYSDFWRFSWDVVDLLFSRFSRWEAIAGGGPLMVARNYLPRVLLRVATSRLVAPLVSRLDRRMAGGRTTPFWLVTATR